MRNASATKLKSPSISILAAFGLFSAVVSFAAETNLPDQVTLFKNVNIFDGKSDRLIKGQDVLVVRNKIHKIGKDILTTRLGRPL